MKTIVFSILCVAISTLSYAQWQQIGSDIDGETLGDDSGRAVSINSNGTMVVIGSPSNSNGQGNTFFGHVRIFEFITGNWVQKGNSLVGEAIGDFSGNPVSINDDGSIVAIGAFNNDGNGEDSGHVRIYEFTSGNWVQKGNDIDGEAAFDRSGGAISLNANGNLIAIGAATNSNIGEGLSPGHVRIYEFTAGNWIQKGNDIDGEAAFDNSGASVSLNDDGTIVAIGAINNDDNGSNSGQVRVYEFTTNNWIQKGGDIDGEAANDQSGNSISLNANGSIIAIGAILNDGNGVSAGHVRIYEFTTGDWQQKGNDVDGEAANDRSGSSVSINEDGNIVAIGADANAGNGVVSGHVRTYKFSSGNWLQIDNDIDGEAAQDRSGSSVSLSDDGSTVAIGAPANTSFTGHVRIYTNNAVLAVDQTSFLEANIMLFPNPTYGKIELRSKNLEPITSISLVDINGRTLKTQNLNCSTCTVNIDKMLGFYFLKINTSSGTITKKIIFK